MSAEIAISTSGRHVTYRRIIWRLLPFLMFCDMFSVIDRVNLSFAKLQFMRDLSLSEATFGAAVGAFYIGFALCGIRISATPPTVRFNAISRPQHRRPIRRI
jgi:hypothetical protein